MKLKPETEIRNLKKRVKDLKRLLSFAGVPPIVIELPELVFNNDKFKKWERENTNEKNKAGINPSL